MGSLPEVILLCGFSGSGKTETGRLLAEIIGYDFTDTDTVVEETMGLSIPEIFLKFGEGRFRFAESDVVRMATMCKPQVIALGGGTIDDENNLKYVKHNGRLVYLKVTPETVRRRLQASHVRPMLQSFGLLDQGRSTPDPERIRALMQEREKYYLQADLVVDTEGKSPDQVAEEIRDRLSQDGPKSRSDDNH